MKKRILVVLSLLYTSLNANNFTNLVRSAHYGDIYAQYHLATQYKHYSQSQQDLLKAFKWYHKSALKGYSASQYQLALMFHYGIGVRQNAELARLWFRRASKKGHPDAQSILYRFYAGGRPEYLFKEHSSYYSRNYR